MNNPLSYILALLIVSFLTFFIGATVLGGTDTPYTDFILTLIAVQLVMAKLLPLNKNE
ncbi:hypothetical protein [Anaerobacillus alkaliphilus]|uniref:hypothetical protein n=1 Tax=Anaerobacillus alkaliphilus TaxID=1548597 RepID=UPI00137546E3|nr:hypothetical protein [Anaerobacillus alkaliphilus]